MSIEILFAVLFTFFVTLFIGWLYVNSQLKYLVDKIENIQNSSFKFTGRNLQCPMISELSIMLDKLYLTTKSNNAKVQYMQSIFDSSNAITVIYDTKYNIIDANKHFYDFFTVNNIQDFTQKYGSVSSFFEDVAEVNYINKLDLDDWIDDATKEDKKVLILKEGQNHFFNVRSKLFTSEDEEFHIVTFMDITEIEGYKIELKILNISLEDKVNAKTKELQELNENLKEKVELELKRNREKDKTLIQQSRLAAMGEMIGNIAHQWRQPLSAISSIASGNQMQVEFGEVNEEEIIDGYKRIFEYTEFLSQTIDDFRDFFREDKTKDIFFIDDIVDKVLSLVSASLKFYDINLSIIPHNGDLKYYGYPNELSQVLLNLISNAKDILREKENVDKEVVIKIEGTQEQVSLIVCDSGGGVPEAIIERIFDPYFTTKHQSQGTGIGLYMSKEIIEKHMHGSLSVKNEPFKAEGKEYFGANFAITLYYTEDILKQI
jgi:signal transduction histidine kinase